MKQWLLILLCCVALGSCSDKDNDDNDRDSSREDDVIEKDDVPFILPFNAVPFP